MESLVDSACCGCGSSGSETQSSEHELMKLSNKLSFEVDEKDMDMNLPIEESDLRSDTSRHVWVVTTAALPWMTGTAVNPMVRALHLTRRQDSGRVALVIPWIYRKQDRDALYGNKYFANELEQDAYLRHYATERCGMPEEAATLKIVFYRAEYNAGFGSIFPTEDICSLVPDTEADVAILEEPEHLNWFRVVPPNKEKDDESWRGWPHKFRYVVGIVHTNYSAYARQVGSATAVLGAPTIGVASALVMRAYCHRVIKLSPVLPVYAPGKEVTENVHGVRDEFLQDPVEEEEEPQFQPKSGSEAGTDAATDTAAIYYIGKTLWAKGFDRMLDLEDHYRRRTGKFFPIDVYGSGPESVAIQRAFHGRESLSSSSSNQTALEASTSTSTSSKNPCDHQPSDKSLLVERVFDDSIRSQTLAARSQQQQDDNGTISKSESDDGVHHGLRWCLSYEDDHEGPHDPLSILYEVTEKSVGTGIATTQAVHHLADSAIQAGLAMAFSPDNTQTKKKLKFDPPKSRFELRRHPIPARFLGRVDHVVLKHEKRYKIFLNPSVSEVLCTTTAEALAMGKFVIIPQHPSNQFFRQFPNCLSYANPAEGVDCLQHALSKDPTPLSEEQRYILTWEAATDRLLQAAITTRKEAAAYGSKHHAVDRRIAWFHAESERKGDAVRNWLSWGHPHPHGDNDDDKDNETGVDNEKAKLSNGHDTK